MRISNRSGNRRDTFTLCAALVLSSWMAAGGCATGASGSGACAQCGATYMTADSPDAGEQALKVVATAGVVVLYVFAAACGAAGSGSWSCSGGSCGSCGH